MRAIFYEFKRIIYTLIAKVAGVTVTMCVIQQHSVHRAHGVSKFTFFRVLRILCVFAPLREIFSDQSTHPEPAKLDRHQKK